MTGRAYAKRVEVRFETLDEFMSRVRETARTADRGEPIRPSRTISFPPEQKAALLEPGAFDRYLDTLDDPPTTKTALRRAFRRLAKQARD